MLRPIIKAKISVWATYLFFVCFVLGLTLVLLIPFLAMMSIIPSAMTIFIVIAMLVLSVCCGLIAAILAGGWYKILCQAVEDNSGDVLEILMGGILLEAPQWCLSVKTKPTFEKILIEQLSAMKRHEYGGLTEKHRRAFYIILENEEQPLVLAALKALSEVGDSKSLKHISNLASGKWQTKYNIDVRKEAQECCFQLQAHMEIERNNRTLLRSSATCKDHKDHDVLLHPSYGTLENISEESEQLLRSTTESEQTAYIKSSVPPLFEPSTWEKR